MPNDYKTVLSAIVHLTDQNDGQTSTSLTHLAHRLNCDPDSILDTVKKLAKEGWIHVDEPNSRIFLIQPTVEGIDKVAGWKSKQRTESPRGRFLSFVKYALGILFGLLVGFLLWWLGFSSDQLEPLLSKVPFKVHDQLASVILEENGRLSYEVLQVKPGSDEITNPDGSIAATLDGRIALSFDVESTAQNHQVNIESIHVEIVHQPPPEIVDILEIFHGRGGGGIWDYEVPLQSTKGMPDSGAVVEAQFIVDERAVDYVYLRPGERETIQIVIDLAETGRYRITPIIDYAFRDKVSSQHLGTSIVYYPQNYRYWRVEGYDQQEQDFDLLPIESIILNTGALTFKQPSSFSYIRQPCFTPNKWIAFTAQVSPNDQRLFVFSTETGHLQLLSRHGRYVSILGWDYNGTLYFSEEHNKATREQPSIEQKAWRSDWGVSSIEPSEVPPGLFAFPSYNTQCLNSDNTCLDTVKQDTDGDGVVTDADLDQVVLVDRDGSIVRKLGDINRWQRDPLLSPDGKSLIYAEGYGCTPGNEEFLFAMNVSAPGQRQLTQVPSDHRTISWSPDSTLLAFADNRSLDFMGNPVCDDQSFQIYVINMITGDESKITEQFRNDTVFGWSSDGEYLLVAGENLALVKQDGSCYQVLLPAFFEDENYFMGNPSFVEAAIQP